MTAKCGKIIGEGKFRIVYENLYDKNFVIKVNKPYIAKNRDIFDHDFNAAEYNNYLLLKKYNLDYWVAQCFYYNGFFLMQKVHKLPRGIYRVPSFFPERKEDNFGCLNNRIVCVDYPTLGQKGSKLLQKLDNYMLTNVNEYCLKNYRITKKVRVK